MKLLGFIFTISVLVSFSLGAAEQKIDRFDIADWKVNCKLEGKQFSLRFHSPAKDATMDDMNVYLQTTHDKSSTVPIDTALYVQYHLATDEKNLCEKIDDFSPGINAISVGGGLVMLFIMKDQRPDADELALIVFDPASGIYHDVKSKVGKIISNELVVLRHKGGWIVRVAREYIGDRVVKDGSYVDDWMYIEVKERKVVTSWLRN